jgi:acyl-CoA thioester hydrolase
MSVSAAPARQTPNTQQNTISLRVRYTECDPMGVTHHAAYPVWFEMGRTELYRATGMSYRDLEAQGLSLAVIALDVRYRAPAHYDDLLVLETTVARCTRVRLQHTYRLFRDGLLLATGSTTLACVDAQHRPRPLPESLTAVNVEAVSSAPASPSPA